MTDQNQASDCPTEALPEVPAAAAARLHQLLDGLNTGGRGVGVFRSRLLEWLALATDARLLIPPEFIVPLLDHRDLAIMFADLTVVVGERGRWLARGNEHWKSRLRLPPEGDPAIEFWRGSSLNRIWALKLLRAAHPGRARELLAAAWDDLDDSARFHAMVWGFRTGLGPDDEPFLESVIANAGQHVKRAAEELLWLLPSSTFVERARARAQATVQISRSPDGVAVSVPRTPSEIDLREIVSWTQPADWPAGVLQAVVRTEWVREIIAGIVQGADRIRGVDPPPGYREMTRALIELVDPSAGFMVRPDLSDTQALLAHLPPDEAEDLIMEQLRERPAVGLRLMGSTSSEIRWSMRRSAAHLSALSRLSGAEAGGESGKWVGLGAFAQRGDPALLEEAETVLTRLADEEPAIAEQVRWALDELRLRRLMREEIGGRA